MKIQYCCEYCGMSFDFKNECEKHESDHFHSGVHIGSIANDFTGFIMLPLTKLDTHYDCNDITFFVCDTVDAIHFLREKAEDNLGLFGLDIKPNIIYFFASNEGEWIPFQEQIQRFQKLYRDINTARGS